MAAFPVRPLGKPHPLMVVFPFGSHPSSRLVRNIRRKATLMRITPMRIGNQFASLAALAFLALNSAAQPKVSAVLDGLPLRNIGPANTGGRIVDIEGVDSDRRIVYAAAATGGVWKTTDDGDN